MTQIDSNGLGEILKQRRLMIPLTLRELATKSGTSSAHLRRIEKGERFPSARILQRLARPLGFEETELFVLANYLPSSAVVEGETQHSLGKLDPYVARVLAEEPAEAQRTIIGILAILKSLGRVGNPAGWPEFREYARRKYPDLGEDLITMIEDLIKNTKG